MIPGRPVPAPRMTIKEWHISRKGGGGRSRNRQIERYQQWRDDVRKVAMVERVRPMDGPVGIRVWVHVHGKVRGDASNYLKAAEDALNGIAFHDDRQIEAALVVMHPAAKDEQRTVIEWDNVTIEEAGERSEAG